MSNPKDEPQAAEDKTEFGTPHGSDNVKPKRLFNDDEFGTPHGSDIVKPKRLFNDDDLLAIQHGGFQTALAAVASRGDVVKSSDLLASFDVLNKNEKDVLVGKPFLILEWRFNDSDKYGDDFVSCVVMTEDEHLYIVNDGSTGIREQLRGITARTDKQHGLLCEKGLRRSDYTVEVDGKEIAASTYYIA